MSKRTLESWLHEPPTDDELLRLQRAGALPDADVERIRDGKLTELFKLEEKHGGQRALLEIRPELADLCAAMQRVRAAVAAHALGIQLRGDGRPIPRWLVDELSRTVRGIVIAEHNRDALG